MDVRGVEITNQLRSAIRAKLLELGVRYDEELPDYILVMVVNKKSRHQMNEDLHLFLEDSTEPFVSWLHDQVLKKLQKVTIAKKKTAKEPIQTVITKQEDEVKTFKIENEFSEDSKCKRDREFEELVGDLALLNEEDNKANIKELPISGNKTQKKRSSIFSTNSSSDSEKKDACNLSVPSKFSTTEKKVQSSPKLLQSETLVNKSNIIDNIHIDKNVSSAKRSKISYDSDDDSANKIKSCISKPKITSIVSVKSRLGNTISPKKKHDLPHKTNNDIRNVLDKNQSDSRKNESQRNYFNQNKNIDRRKSNDSSIDTKLEKINKTEDLRNKVNPNSKSGTVKSRLGISNSHKQDNKSSLKSSNSTKVSKPRISNVKSRLGIRNKQIRGSLSVVSKLSQISLNKDFVDEDDDTEPVINTSLKSHIIAVKKPKSDKPKKKDSQTLRKQSNININTINDIKNDDIEEEHKLPSKIIVTPRPLKPLKPSQKRATQSLLLKAVAEANQSVVMKKKMDPCLTVKEQKPENNIKIVRDPWEGKVLSVNLKSNKRLVMEKIQVELPNPDAVHSLKSHSDEIVTDEHMDVVRSLFQRSDNKQKFLVTLNGYNNNILKERNSDDEERLEMEVTEDDELVLANNQYETYIENHQMIEEHEQDMNEEDIVTEYMEQKIDNNINIRLDNIRQEEHPPLKRRKLSPIVYTRSRSSSPENKPVLSSTVSSVLRVDKRPLVSSIITTVADKSSEKCRYWPNCTLGIKCAYYHPEVLCSSFPACKFGDKCAYKHPKCKFGSACTKLGCMFSHPPLQCKYHPYCMKPGCPFSHPKNSISSPLTPLTPDISSVRAKFTWKKKE